VKDLRYFDPHRRATWLELFFDLIFVVAIGDATEILSETSSGHVEAGQLFGFVLVFVPLWWIWVGHTMYANRFDTDSRQHRFSTLVIMFLLTVLSALIRAGMEAHYAAAVGCYCAARLVVAAMYYVSRRKHHDLGGVAIKLCVAFSAGAAISLSSILLAPPWRYGLFYAGILFDMLGLILLNRGLGTVPVHTRHLVERVGLLTIILLGESVFSISAGLADIQWRSSTIATAISGFIMVASIWWIYYDSFYLLETRRLATGHAIVYSHLFLFIGLSVLASLIRHAILNDIAVRDFQLLAAIGTGLFFLGKQFGYFMEVPELRPYLVTNTLAVFALTALALLGPSQVQAMLVGLTITMICYVLLNRRYRGVIAGLDRPARPAGKVSALGPADA
jgi:low temperature requirement protein LtrA